jgi:hypothetical protein
MDTFLPAAVVLLTLGSIGLALVNLNAEKNVNKNYTEESIRGKLHLLLHMETILFGYGIGKYSIDRFSSILRDQAYSDYFFWK